MRIQVKAKHIKKGDTRRLNTCPIALAIKEQVPQVVRGSVQVGLNCIMYRVGKKIFRILVVSKKRNVYDFIDRFDSGRKVKPFSFELTN